MTYYYSDIIWIILLPLNQFVNPYYHRTVTQSHLSASSSSGKRRVVKEAFYSDEEDQEEDQEEGDLLATSSLSLSSSLLASHTVSSSGRQNAVFATEEGLDLTEGSTLDPDHK